MILEGIDLRYLYEWGLGHTIHKAPITLLPSINLKTKAPELPRYY